MARVKLLLFCLLTILVFFLGTLVTRETAEPPEVKAQSTSVPASCGEKLADYMNTIISGASSLQGIRLTSPIFNLTNPREFAIYQSMEVAGANWAGLDAFAGNTYRISGNAPYYYYATNPAAAWKASFGGKPIILTEFGNYDQQAGAGNQNVPLMTQDYNQAVVDGSILGINYFNAMGTGGSEWSGYILSSSEFNTITASIRSKSGVNSAAQVNGSFNGNLRGYSAGAGWSVEILYGTGDLTAAIDAVNSAFSLGITPVLRLCAQTGGCGFVEPDALVQFLVDLNAAIPAGRYVYVTAGPNEPATDLWLAPECGEEVAPEPSVPFDIVDVPCGETYQSVGANDGREYHSLRPYPASPCDRNYDESIQTYMCGHNLIAKQIYEVTPADATGWDGGPGCEETDDGSLCRYEFQSSVRIGVDLTNAELPIAGNTEDVPNAESAASGLSFAQRVNNYVSWYLNGTTSRAEEEDETIKTAPPYFFFQVTPLSQVTQRINEVINYSGPIKKLLPFAIQNGGFIMQQIGPLLNPSVVAYPIPGQPGLRGTQQELAYETRHNQIAVCEVAKIVDLPFPVRCYRGQDASRVRITEIGPFIGLPGPIFQEIDTYNPLFSFIPFSSTEDLVGRARVDNVAPNDLPGGGLAGDPFASTAEIVPVDPARPDTPVRYTPSGSVDDANRSYHSLYFAHMQEDTELAEYLQRTFLPQGRTGNDGNISFLVPPQYCEVLESRTNPGDDLHGEYANGRDGVSEPEPDQPGGDVDYRVRFSCLFAPQEPPLPGEDPGFDACVAACREGEANQGLPFGTVDCEANCAGGDQTCQKNALVAMSVSVGTPKADDLWNRLVWGEESIFRRMFPRVMPGAPVDFIEDIPAHSNAVYSAAGISGLPVITGTESLAGNPGLSRPGSAARLYFPHLGGIHEYFLEQIQTALRPYRLGESP